MSRHRRPLLALLAAFGMVIPLLVLTEQPAQAQTSENWFATALPNFEDSSVYPTLDGKVLQVGCKNRTTGSETSGPYVYTYDSTGTPISNLSGVFEENVTSCNDDTGDTGSIIGADGTLYAVRADYTGSYDHIIVASKDGVVDWTLQTPISDGCSTRPHAWELHIGTDQDLYFMGSTQSSSCDYDAYLFGVDVQTGTFKFQVPFEDGPEHHIGMHNSGIIQSAYGEEFRFFDYNGNENPQLAFSIPLGAGEFARNWKVHPDGRTYHVVTQNDDTTCTDSKPVAHKVVSRGLDGTESTYDVSGYCLYMGHLRVTPNGGAVLSGKNWNDGGNTLVYTHPDGTTSAADRSYQSFDSSDRHLDFRVDMRGNILTVQEREDDLQFTLIGPDGSVQAQYSTAAMRVNEYESFSLGRGHTNLADGAIYSAICYGDQYAGCGDNPSYHKLLKVGFVEADFEYPESALLGYQSQPVDSRDLVVMGDSFASGEGVEPFDPATNTVGPPENRCHRSELAYAHLLGQSLDPAVSNISLEGFIACSGARSYNILDSGQAQWPNEPPQSTDPTLNANTDIVTISIGGNDLGFATVAEACTSPFDAGGIAQSPQQWEARCAQARTDAWNQLANDNIANLVATALLDVRGTTSPQTEIYLMGYPNPFPDWDEVDHAFGCNWGWETDPVFIHPGKRTMTEGELDDLTSLSAELNRQIALATAGLGAEYVDTATAFDEHAVCSDEPWINDVYSDEQQQVYSYHPNQLGHQKFYEILREAITT